MRMRNYEKLEEEHSIWLEETCECHHSWDVCECMTFEDWLAFNDERAVEMMDSMDLEEQA